MKEGAACLIFITGCGEAYLSRFEKFYEVNFPVSERKGSFVGPGETAFRIDGEKLVSKTVLILMLWPVVDGFSLEIFQILEKRRFERSDPASLVVLKLLKAFFLQL